MCHELRARAATAGQGGRAAEAGSAARAAAAVRAVMRCAADGGTAALAVLHRQSAGRGGPHSAAAAVAAAPAAVGGAAKACPAVRAAPPLPGVPPTMHMPPTLCRQHRRRAQFVCYVFVCSVGWCAKTAAARSGFGVADFLWKEVLQLPMDRAPHDGFFSMPWKLFDLPANLQLTVRGAPDPI